MLAYHETDRALYQGFRAGLSQPEHLVSNWRYIPISYNGFRPVTTEPMRVIKTAARVVNGFGSVLCNIEPKGVRKIATKLIRKLSQVTQRLGHINYAMDDYTTT